MDISGRINVVNNKNDKMLTNEDLVEYFGESKIRNRFNTVYTLLSMYIERENLGNFVIISNSILEHTIVDYFRDIYRLKEFHKEIEFTNETKITSYLAFWLCHRKPLQVIQTITPDTDKETEQKLDELVFVNESMVCSFIEEQIFQNPEVPASLDENNRAYKEFLENLLYVLKYRQFTAQNIESMILAFNAGRAYQSAVDIDL